MFIRVINQMSYELMMKRAIGINTIMFNQFADDPVLVIDKIFTVGVM